MLTLRTMILLGAIAIPSLAAATDRATAPTEIRLSQAEIDQVLADAATKREARSLEPEAEPARRQVHGEVGFEIGTGGTRSVYGTTAIELPNDGFASFSFETSDFGRSNRHER